jgi:hypothetical protein
MFDINWLQEAEDGAASCAKVAVYDTEKQFTLTPSKQHAVVFATVKATKELSEWQKKPRTVDW